MLPITFWIILIPSALLFLSWGVMMLIMRETTGELKLFLTPENLVKIFVIYLGLIITAILTLEDYISGESATVIISGLTGYAIGAKFEKNDN